MGACCRSAFPLSHSRNAGRGRFAACFLSVAICFAGAAARANLLTNGDYEIGPTTGGVIPGWSGNTATGYYFGLSTAVGGLAPENGDQFAFVNNFNDAADGSINAIAQQTAVALTAGTKYTFSSYVGWRVDNVQSIGTLQLWAGGTVSQGVVVGGTLLASENVTLTQGAWTLASIDYTALAGSPLLNEDISVELIGTPVANGFAQTDFDNAVLTDSVPVPEPASAAVLGTAALTLRAICRRRRRGMA